MKGKRKILLVRFSSMGDIILTTPVIRATRNSFPDAEIHFATKASFAELMHNCPYLHRVWALEDDFSTFASALRAENFDVVLDLHHNLRSCRLAWELGIPVFRFPKLNLKKWLFTNFKWDILPEQHIVERYALPLVQAGGRPDEAGLEVWIPETVQQATSLQRASFTSGPLIAGVLGGTFATKKWPAEYHAALYNLIGLPVVLLGGSDEMEAARTIRANLKVPVLDLTGHATLDQAFAWIRMSKFVITHDTGLMHAAAALQVPSVVIWGNTTPRFGMEPYRSPHINIGREDVSCRPCSKLGHDACPKGHFECMRKIQPEDIHTRILQQGWI